MGSVDLSGVAYWLHTVNTIPSLAVMILSSCGLNKSNTPTSLQHHNLTVLEELDLSYNPFQGPSASNWFWDITSLKRLHLRGCELSGTFPDELGNLTLLETFDVQGNNIQGMIPATLKNMCDRALAHGPLRVRHLTRSLVPSSYHRKSNGRLASVAMGYSLSH